VLLRLTVFGIVLAAAVAVLQYLLDTPQPLESLLPGEPHLYRWQNGHIFYKTLGDKSTPPLVLLHAPGIAASAYEMRKIAPALAQTYFIYTPDLLGFGLSDRPRLEYSADTYISLCHDFLTNVVGQPATIIASGLSCNYAVILAKYYPECCSDLVLLSPLEVLGNTRKSWLWSYVLAFPMTNLLLYAFLSTRSLLRVLLSKRISLHQKVARSAIDYLYATTHQFGAEHAPMALLKGALTVNASQAFDTLQQPTLIIWGAKALNATRSLTSSPYGPYALPDTMEMALIQDAGTCVHEEYPAIVVAHIREWHQAVP